MINKKVFALTLIASSVIAAGCSSDDDDDEEVVFDQTSDAVLTDAQSVDVTGDGILTDDDDFNGDGFIDNTDVELFAAVVADDNSTDVNGDGSIDGNDDIDRDGDIDDDDVTAFGGGITPDPDPMEPTVATLPAADAYDPSILEPVPTANLAELATAAGLTQLVQNVGGCDFAGALSDPEARLTVFAPTDEAFGEQAVIDALGAGADVCDVIAGHVLVGTVANSTDLTANVGNVAETLAGTTVEIAQGDDDTLTIGGATVVTPDNYATNGVAHIISSVILPMAEEEEMEGEEGEEGEGTTPEGSDGPSLSAISGAGNSEFISIYTASAFGAALDDNAWTVFVPSNDAIDDGVGASIAGDAEQAVAVVQDHVLTEGAFGPDQLPTTATTNGGVALNIVSNDDGITVNGFNATQIESDGTSAIYQIDGLLQ